MKWPQRLEWREKLAAGWLGEILTTASPDETPPVVVRLLSPAAQARSGPLYAAMRLGMSARHPHILPTTPPEQHGEQMRYLMPLAQAGSLRQLLSGAQAHGGLATAQAVDLIRQAASALAFAHEQDLTHGNLKPENVLLQPLQGRSDQPEYHVLLSDFGLSALRPPERDSPYLSPEQRAGQQASVPGDLYSLGTLLFESLTGRRPPLDFGPGDLATLPGPLRRLIARSVGLQTPYAGVGALLEELRQFRSSLGQDARAADTEPLRLGAEQDELLLIPGERQTVHLHLRAREPLDVSLATEGFPDSWVTLPPPVTLQPGVALTVPLKIRVPRSADATPQTYTLTVLATRHTSEAHQPLLARLTLAAQVQPYESGQLELRPEQRQVAGSATLHLHLQNDGNQVQQYSLEVSLPAGCTVVHGSLRQQLRLLPGSAFHETLDIRLPFTGRARPLVFTAVAQSLSPQQPQGEAAWPPAYRTLRDSVTLQQRASLPLPWWAGLLLLGVLGGVGAWAAQPPRITQFGLVGPAPVQGEPFTLGWKTSGAWQVRILELPDQPLNRQGRVDLAGLKGDKTYTLIASGPLREQRQQLTVRPRRPAARIQTFRVTPQKAFVGQEVRVEWSVPNAQTVQLTPFGTVPATGSREYTLQQDTTFALAVPASSSGPALRSVVRASLKAPVVRRFDVTPETVRPGQSVTLRWEVHGATQVRLAPFGDLPEQGSRALNPRRSGTYVLKASNGQQEVLANVAVTVRAPQPRIEAFTVVPQRPVIGQPLKVFWRVAYAERVELRWGDQRQELPSRGQLKLIATPQMGTLNLVARGAEGEPLLSSRQVDLVAPAPTPAPVQTPRTPAPAKPALSQEVPTPPPGTAPSPVQPAPRTAPAPSSRTATPPPASVPPPQPAAQPRPAKQPQPVTQPRPTPQARPATPIRIRGFRAVPAQVRVGEPVTLKWQVSGGKSVVLRNGQGQAIGRFPATGSTTLRASRVGPLVVVLRSAEQPTQQASVRVQVLAAPAPVVPAKPATPPPATTRPPAAPSPATRPPVSPSPASVRILSFAALPATVQAGTAPTLSWRVSGVSKVYLQGIPGPNRDGSFPPSGSVIAPRLQQSRTFILSAGGQRRSATVTVRRSAFQRAAPVPQTPAPGPVPGPVPGPATVPRSPLPQTPDAAADFGFLGGSWSHSFGSLSLQVRGTRVTGVLLSNRPGLTGGQLRGSISGTPDSPSLTGFVTSGGQDYAVALRFDPVQATFEGVYGVRTTRERWCGWKTVRPRGC